MNTLLVQAEWDQLGRQITGNYVNINEVIQAEQYSCSSLLLSFFLYKVIESS